MKKVARHSYINGPEYVEVCNSCGIQSKACHTDFKELNRLNREAGWKIRLKDKKWVGYCPDCVRKFMECFTIITFEELKRRLGNGS